MTEDYTPADFDIEDDFKPEPLIPRGIYHGSVTKVTLVTDKCYIMWEITFADNGMMMSDDETPVDGAKLIAFNYLPKPGDADELTASGKNNKRQSKINMLAQFAQTLGITSKMKNLLTITETIENAEFIGMEVDAAVIIDEYNGRVSSKIDKLTLQQ